MTEAEWLACTDPTPMLEFLVGKASDRKMRLFAVASCRRIWHLLRSSVCKEIVDNSEEYADGKLSSWQVSVTWGRGAEVRFANNGPVEWAASAALILGGPLRMDAVAVIADLSALANVGPSSNREAAEQSRLEEVERRHQSAVLRDIFGNPLLSSPTVPPTVLAWNDRTVRRIAEGIYEDRKLPEGLLNTARLAILSDALLDAGCEDESLMEHCRSAGPHFRGCWAIDLILGKS